MAGKRTLGAVLKEYGNWFTDDIFKFVYFDTGVNTIWNQGSFEQHARICSDNGLVLIKAWRRTGDKSFSIPMSAHFSAV